MGGVMQPGNPLVGGTVLRRAAIQSPNFVTKVSGWTINQDGSAEFNNVTIRGTLNGTQYIINATGAFFYNGTPGPATLAASIAPAGGTDPFGTAVQVGFVSYGSSSGAGGVYTRIDSGIGIVFVDPANMITAPEITSATVLTVSDALQLTSPAKLITDQQAVLALIRAPAAGTARVQIANASLHLKTSTAPGAPANGTQLYVDAAGKLAHLPQAGTAMQVPGAKLATFPGITVTQAALTTLASDTYPGGDAEVGSVYELECNGNGVWGSTQQSLQLAVSFGGNVMASFTIGALAMPVSTAFRWAAKIRVICHTTGAAGTWSSEIRADASATGNLLPANAANPTGAFVSCEAATLTTVDSTVNQALALQAAWGSTTGAPTLTSRAAIPLKRIA